MKVSNTVENAVTGITIKLSIAEQMVLANLQDELQEQISPSGKRVMLQAETVNNVVAFLSKLNENTYTLEQAKQELFAPMVGDRQDVEQLVKDHTPNAYLNESS